MATLLNRNQEVGSNFIPSPAVPTVFRGFLQAIARLMLETGLSSFEDVFHLRNTFKILILALRKNTAISKTNRLMLFP
jgi:hypothetical protein